MQDTTIIDHSYFNSIKVRLELSDFIIRSAAAFGFQFHKGAIRTF